MTAETDRAEIELRDGSRILLDYDTHLKIAGAAGEGSDVRPATLYLRNGRIWLLLTRAQAGMVVYTPTSRAEAFGTMFSLSVDRDAQGFSGERSDGLPNAVGLRTSLAVVRGKVELSNQRGMITVAKGGYAEVADGGPTVPSDAAQRLNAIRLQVPWGQEGFIDWAPERPSWADSLTGLAGERAWLGVELERTIAADASGAEGVSVTRVAEGSPARVAGIRPGDRLLRIGDVAVGSRDDLARSELVLSPGQQVRLLIERDGRCLEPAITLAQLGSSSPEASGEALARANRQFAKGEVEAAARAYEAIIANGQQEPAAWHNLGVAREVSGHVESAVLAYREAVNLSPKSARYRFSLAMGLFGIGNLPRAADELEAVLATDSTFPDSRLQLGRIRALSGEYEAAVEQAQALQAQPGSSAQGYCLMGDISVFRGDVKEAKAWYLRALQAAPAYLDAQILLARACFVQGRLGEAQGWAKSALKLAPGSLQALNVLGLTLLGSGSLDEAEQVLVKAAALHPESGKVYNNLGLLYLKKKDLSASRAAYRKAVALAPGATWCHAGLAVAMERSGQFDAAKKEYALALRLDPAYEAAYQQLASLHRRLGETEFAQRTLAKARQYGLGLSSAA